MMEQELEAEIVISPSVEQTISSGDFASLFRETMQTSRLTVHVADSELPFYLGLADDRTVQLAVEDDEGFRERYWNPPESRSESGRKAYIRTIVQSPGLYRSTILTELGRSLCTVCNNRTG